MKKLVTFSDLTGEAISDPVQIRVWLGDNKEHFVDVDRSEAVVEQLLAACQTRAKRGRKKKA